MATKRAKKKTTKKRATRKTARKATRKKTAAQPATSRWKRKLLILLALIVCILSGMYYFGSFETRARMEQCALSAINLPRTSAVTPAPIAAVLDNLHDLLPSSEGLVVEGGELGRNDNSFFLAGIPHSRQAVRVLPNPSHSNLFSENSLQATCVAIRLDDATKKKAEADTGIQVDARVAQLTAQALTDAQWQPQPIAPASALIRQHGTRGAKDAQLATNHFPMSEALASGVWKKAMHELTQRYPQRFGEVWIYLGPVYSNNSLKLASGILVPDAYYAIALDLTNAGGLRAMALLIPSDAESKNLNDYLTSITQIEKQTGLQFLPELGFSIRDTLGNYVSPSVW
ncbi:DNA/RNA non-specific endonuclease [Coraliomargarita sp. SDUM461004]|uniref:DNA/RNA non-specific endonuclease n=1 Tax=Thalassobacterium sedimentorum TaxID=3041258 RepID=A0ABU1AL98_9BACT|nr:DNA/RNA non-specific endonuclease [Coraliomargarita sp. SDUM461004]MDQ8195454.1 DNA/RNA non-specific endonuclease [Coraliomargarita sp. SDUM461004]